MKCCLELCMFSLFVFCNVAKVQGEDANVCQQLTTSEVTSKVQSVFIDGDSKQLVVIVSDKEYRVSVSHITQSMVHFTEKTRAAVTASKPSSESNSHSVYSVQAIQSKITWWHDSYLKLCSQYNSYQKEQMLVKLHVYRRGEFKYQHYVFANGVSVVQNRRLDKPDEHLFAKHAEEAKKDYSVIEDGTKHGFWMEKISGKVRFKNVLLYQGDHGYPKKCNSSYELYYDEKEKNQVMVVDSIDTEQDLGKPLFNEIVHGFIYEHCIHLWHFAKQTVYILKEKSICEEKDQKRHIVPMIEVPMKDYFKCEKCTEETCKEIKFERINPNKQKDPCLAAASNDYNFPYWLLVVAIIEAIIILVLISCLCFQFPGPKPTNTLARPPRNGDSRYSRAGTLRTDIEMQAFRVEKPMPRPPSLEPEPSGKIRERKAKRRAESILGRKRSKEKRSSSSDTSTPTDASKDSASSDKDLKEPSKSNAPGKKAFKRLSGCKEVIKDAKPPPPAKPDNASEAKKEPLESRLTKALEGAKATDTEDSSDSGSDVQAKAASAPTEKFNAEDKDNQIKKQPSKIKGKASKNKVASRIKSKVVDRVKSKSNSKSQSKPKSKAK